MAGNRWYDSHPGAHYKSNKKWRKRHPSVWSRTKSRYYNKHSRGAIRGGRLWEQWEIDLLMKHSIPDVLLAKKLKRTLRAICVKRVNVKKLGDI